MRKLLFIAYDFPPCKNVGGSLRSDKFVHYLTDFGWQATVLTCGNSKSTDTVRFPHINRVQSWIPIEVPYNVKPYGWVPAVYCHGMRILSNGNYDSIYISCPPFPPSLAAVALKLHHKIPLVVDFRDAWTLSPYKTKNLVNNLIDRFLFPLMEQEVLKKADWFIVNSQSTMDEYLKVYPSISKKISIIPNGFDEKEFADYAPETFNQQLTLFYSGSFGISGRSPDCLLMALKKLINTDRSITLQLLGEQGLYVRNLVNKLNLKNHVNFVGQVPHSEVILSMSKCDALILYQEQSTNAVTPVAGKTHEYLRSGKPIIAVMPAGDNLDLIKKYAGYYQKARPDDIESIAQALSALYADWKAKRLVPHMIPKRDYLKKYNRKALTKRLCRIFEMNPKVKTASA